MRTQEEIRAEYSNLCAQAGEKAYLIKRLEFEIASIYKRCNELQQEIQTLLEAQKKQPGEQLDLVPHE